MPKKINLELTEPQARYALSDARHPGMVAGYGAGKSQAAISRNALNALRFKGAHQAFVEPTFDLVRLIAWPRYSALLDEWGVDHELNKSESIIRLENDSMVIFRSADNPERMVGFEVADADIDEADTLRPTQAADVWSKMLARCRLKKLDGRPNTLGAVSTPEGFGWMYQTFGRELKPGYELIRAPTDSNPHLPDGYIEQLRNTYSSAQLSAYLDGEFVNLTQGSVYHEFDRTRHATRETIRSNEPLHIGMDFNVMKGAAAVAVLRDDFPHFVDELTDVFDTPAMCDAIKSRHPGHAITIYPDASGGSRKSQNASESDIAVLRRSGFRISAPAKNPAVKDRVAAVNALLRADRLKVNPDRCPNLCEALERQAYDKNGEPDKSGGFDHILEGCGYLVNQRHPIKSVRARSFAV